MNNHDERREAITLAGLIPAIPSTPPEQIIKGMPNGSDQLGVINRGESPILIEVIEDVREVLIGRAILDDKR